MMNFAKMLAMAGFLGGGSGVSSWNDLTDKPFGIETVEIFPETTLTAMEGNNGEFAIPAGITLEIGKTYIVTYNGTPYTCVAIDGGTLFPDLAGSGAAAIGNYALVLGTGDTGEPFVAVSIPGEDGVIVDINNATSITVSLAVGDVQQIDPMFIPNSSGVLNETPFVLSGIGEGVAHLYGGGYLSGVEGGSIWNQLEKGLIALTFSHYSSDGTEIVTDTVNMLVSGRIESIDGYDVCEAYGFYFYDDILYIANGKFGINTGNREAGATVNFSITPQFATNPAINIDSNHTVFSSPVICDLDRSSASSGIKRYVIGIDSNGALVPKEI